MSSLRRIFGIMQKELIHVNRDFIMFSICFIAPLLLMMLVGFLYIEQKVIHVPVVLYDQDQTGISRKVIRAFADSERFQIVATVQSYGDLEKELTAERSYVGIVIPKDFEKSIKAGHATEVGLMINGANMIITNTAVTYGNQVIQTISTGVNIQLMEGKWSIAQRNAYQAATAIGFRYRIWFNPANSYLVFMLPGLLGVIIQQVALLGIALSFAKERESGTWRQLALSKLRSFEVFCGKYLFYLVIFLLDTVVLYWLGFSYFGLPLRGNLGLLAGSAFLFVVGVLGLGILISSFTKTAAQAIEFSMLLAVPSFLVSGFTWPYFSMPLGIKVISRILPLSYFLEASRSVMIMGNGLEVVGSKLFILSLFAIICLPAAYLLIDHRMKRSVVNKM